MLVSSPFYQSPCMKRYRSDEAMYSKRVCYSPGASLLRMNSLKRALPVEDDDVEAGRSTSRRRIMENVEAQFKNLFTGAPTMEEKCKEETMTKGRTPVNKQPIENVDLSMDDSETGMKNSNAEQTCTALVPRPMPLLFANSGPPMKFETDSDMLKLMITSDAQERLIGGAQHGAKGKELVVWKPNPFLPQPQPDVAQADVVEDDCFTSSDEEEMCVE